MSMPIRKTFTVAVSRERAWAAFADSHERSQWEAESYEIDPVVGGKVRWSLPGIESVGVVEEVVPLERLRHRECRLETTALVDTRERGGGAVAHDVDRFR